MKKLFQLSDGILKIEICFEDFQSRRIIEMMVSINRAFQHAHEFENLTITWNILNYGSIESDLSSALKNLKPILKNLLVTKADRKNFIYDIKTYIEGYITFNG